MGAQSIGNPMDKNQNWEVHYLLETHWMKAQLSWVGVQSIRHPLNEKGALQSNGWNPQLSWCTVCWKPTGWKPQSSGCTMVSNGWESKAIRKGRQQNTILK